MCRSVPQIPQQSTRTRTSLARGDGSGTFATRKLPGLSSTMARMAPPSLDPADAGPPVGSARAAGAAAGSACEPGAGHRVEREHVLWPDVEAHLLARRWWLPAFGPRDNRVAALRQPHVQQRVGP